MPVRSKRHATIFLRRFVAIPVTNVVASAPLAGGTSGRARRSGVVPPRPPRWSRDPLLGSMCMSKSLVEMASEIVAAQARQAPMSHEEISAGVKKVFAMLQQLQGLEAGMPGKI